jgi:hypothetical protein
MAKAGHVHHWKHGWIPLDSVALAKIGPKRPNLALRTSPVAAKKPPTPVRRIGDLSPGLQAKIRSKMETLTGIPEPELAKKVQQNLIDMARNNPGQENWYPEQKARLADIAGTLGTTPERFTGMVAVTSAEKRWVENVDFAQKIAAKLQADEPFELTQRDIDDYNRWVGARKGLAKLHPELKPGTYRPSDLPSDFAASKTPDMPKAKNTDAVIKATKIYRGEATLDEVIQGPKQRSFVDNLMDPSDDRFVTVDTWHYRAAMKGIPVTRTVKGGTFNYTLEEWTDRDLARADGRAAATGFDPNLKVGRSGDNLKALQKAADNQDPQTIFQGAPSAIAEKYEGGTYPWFVEQTQKAAEVLGMSPNAIQADAWYAVGGGA